MAKQYIHKVLGVIATVRDDKELHAPWEPLDKAEKKAPARRQAKEK